MVESAWVPMPQLNSGEEHAAFDAAHELKPEGKKGTLAKAEGSIDASTTNQAGQN